MKVLLKCLLLMLMVANVSYGRQDDRFKRIHAMKMAYLVDKLQLSEDQSGKFIPIYKDYERDFRAIRQPFMKKYNVRQGADSEDFTARQYVEDDLDYQQQVIELKRRYNDRFLKVITSQQLSDMYIAEREFRRGLMKMLQHKKEENGGRRRR